jgi:hypothetical protein
MRWRWPSSGSEGGSFAAPTTAPSDDDIENDDDEHASGGELVSSTAAGIFSRSADRTTGFSAALIVIVATLKYLWMREVLSGTD